MVCVGLCGWVGGWVVCGGGWVGGGWVGRVGGGRWVCVCVCVCVCTHLVLLVLVLLSK